MITQSYLQTIRDDLLARVTGGDVLLNDTVSVPVQAVTISSHPIAGVQNGIALQVSAQHVSSVPVITSAKLRTSTGAVVAEKTANIEMNGAQFVNLTFVVEVKGGCRVTYHAKTNWKQDDPVTEVDINRWEQGIADAHATIAVLTADVSNLKTRMNVMESTLPENFCTTISRTI